MEKQVAIANQKRNTLLKLYKLALDIKYGERCFAKFKDLKQIGYQLVEIGAGRKHKEDKLNYNSGIELYFKQNDFVKKNQKLSEKLLKQSLFCKNYWDVRNEFVAEMLFFRLLYITKSLTYNKQDYTYNGFVLYLPLQT